MKKITYLLFLLFALNQGFSQVRIGTGTNTTQRLPFAPNEYYSYGQSIYLASEINASGTITAIKWYFNGSTSLQYSQDIKIYLGHTAKTGFTASGLNVEVDWVNGADMTLVYSGGIEANGANWVTIPLDTPFDYNGTSNLVVGVTESMAGYDAQSDNFYNTEVNGPRSISDIGLTADVNVPPTSGYVTNYVPNIVFEGISQSCPTPYALTASAVTPASATVSWNSDAIAAGGSEYYVSTENVTPGVSAAPTGSIPSGTSIMLESGLSPETRYYVWVRDLCGEGNKSAWSLPASFKTPCNGVSEFYEDFDAVPDQQLPECWTSIIKNNPEGQVMAIPSFAHSPSNAVTIYGGYNQGNGDVILVSPRLLNLGSGTHRLKFYGSAQTAGAIEIGSLNTDGNAEDAVFTPFANINLTTTPNVYTVDFSGYGESGDSFIGIKVLNDMWYSGAYLDDIRWEPIPPCPDVTEIAVSQITPDGATVSWNEGGIENSWELAVGEEVNTDPDTLPVIASNFSNKAISGLLPGTNYNVWVRSACSSTEKGAWIGPVTFSTECLLSVFNENFDGVSGQALPFCWSSIMRGDTVSPNAYILTQSFVEVHSGPNSAEFYNDNSGTTDDIILASPYLPTLPLGTHRLKFYVRNNSGTPAGIEIGTLDNKTADAQFTPIQPVITINNGPAALYTVDFTVYTGTDHYIGFRMSNEESYARFYLDDIIWEVAPTCPDVNNIIINDIMPDSGKVSWESVGAETAWDVVISDTAVTAPDGLALHTASATDIVLDGLAANTAYNVWVRSVCAGNDNGGWIGPVTFTTDCAPVTSLNENFDGVSYPFLPSCWTKILRGPTLSQYASLDTNAGNNVHSEPNSVQFSNYDTAPFSDADIILVSPNLSTAGSGNYRLRFYAKGYGSLQVGTLNSNTANAEFYSVADVNTVEETGQYIVDFNTYVGTNRYVGIRMNIESQYASINIDNVIWEPIPACPDMENVAATATGAFTAQVTWDQGAAQTEWQVVYATDAAADPSAIQGAANVTQPNAELSGLIPNTTYYIWLRTVCSGGYGAWSEPVTITTACDAADLPYVEDFDNAETYTVPDCTFSVNAGTGNIWYVDYPPSVEGFDTKVLSYFHSFSSEANTWFFTRGINLTAGTDYKISYKYGNNSTVSTDSFKVMYGMGQNVESMTIPVADYPSVTGANANDEDITFTPSETGVYYFGFQAYSELNQSSLYIDDIRIDTALSTGDFNAQELSYFPNPVKNVLHIANSDVVTAVAVYNLLGQKVIQQTFNTSEVEVDMSPLAAGAYIVKVIAGHNEKSIRVIRQ